MFGRLALVVCGGGLGAAGRYGMESLVRWGWPAMAGRFPMGILLVNCLGCLVFGLIAGAAGGVEAMTPARRLFLLTGVLGGFTTFSTFGHDTARLLSGGQASLALLNVMGSVVLGVSAVVAGLWIGRWLATG